MTDNEYSSAEHALRYLASADTIPHRTEGEAELLRCLPKRVRRILDLGCGDGRLLALVRLEHPGAAGVAADLSPTMLEEARRRFASVPQVRVIELDLNRPLPDLGAFDAVVSSFAIHHSPDARKRELYGEVYACLESGGVFCNLEHVASPTPSLHQVFLERLGITAAEEDVSNRLLAVEPQLAWLREIGFVDVDCHWKWRELALLVGVKP